MFLYEFIRSVLFIISKKGPVFKWFLMFAAVILVPQQSDNVIFFLILGKTIFRLFSWLQWYQKLKPRIQNGTWPLFFRALGNTFFIICFLSHISSFSDFINTQKKCCAVQIAKLKDHWIIQAQYFSCRINTKFVKNRFCKV